MRATLVGEDEGAYTMHDGKSAFRVPKKGLSDALHARIRGMAKPMAEGGVLASPTLPEEPPTAQGQLALAEAARQQRALEIEQGYLAPPILNTQPTPRQSQQVDVTPAAVQAVSNYAAPPNPAGWSSPADSPPSSAPPSSAPAMVADAARGAAPTAAQVAAISPNAPVKPASRPPPDSLAMEERAGEMQADIEKQKRDADASRLQENYETLKNIQTREEDLHKAGAARRDADMAAIQRQQDALANINTTVDPNRYFASMSTGGKIATALGLVLGGIGAGNDGVNRAVGVIDNAINRDVEAQKATHAAQFQKAQMGMQAAQTMYGIHRDALKDDEAATLAAKDSAFAVAQNKADLAAAATSSPQYQQALMKLKADIQGKREALRAQMAATSYKRGMDEREMALKESEADTKAREAQAKMGAEGYVAPGWELAPGAHPEKEELATFRKGLAVREELNGITSQLRDLANAHGVGGLLAGEDAKKATLLHNQGVLKLKEMAALRALNPSDIPFLEGQLPDPTTLKANTLTSNRTLGDLYDLFDEQTDARLSANSHAIGVRPAKGKPRASPSSPPGAGARPGVVYQNEKGQKIRLNSSGTAWEVVA